MRVLKLCCEICIRGLVSFFSASVPKSPQVEMNIISYGKHVYGTRIHSLSCILHSMDLKTNFNRDIHSFNSIFLNNIFKQHNELLYANSTTKVDKELV